MHRLRCSGIFHIKKQSYALTQYLFTKILFSVSIMYSIFMCSDLPFDTMSKKYLDLYRYMSQRQIPFTLYDPSLFCCQFSDKSVPSVPYLSNYEQRNTVCKLNLTRKKLLFFHFIQNLWTSHNMTFVRALLLKEYFGFDVLNLQMKPI